MNHLGKTVDLSLPYFFLQQPCDAGGGGGLVAKSCLTLFRLRD